MKFRNKLIVLTLLTILVFVLLYYFVKPTSNNKFIIEPKKSEVLTTEEASKVGNELLNDAVMFYEGIPSNIVSEKTIDGEVYLKLKPFTTEANKIFTKKELYDFLDYYKILRDKGNYYIKETNNKLVYIYDEYSLEVKEITKKEITYKVTWQYCYAVSSSKLSECEDTKSMMYKNTFKIKLKGKNWLISDFSLPKDKKSGEESED